MNMNMNNDLYAKTGNEEYKDVIVDKESESVAYNDKLHIYVGKNGCAKGKKYTSVTTLIGKYHKHFDSDFVSSFKALEALLGVEKYKKLYKKLIMDSNKFDNDYYLREGITEEEFLEKKNEILAGWKKTNVDACERGTAIHSEMENSFYKKKFHDLSKYNIGGKIQTHKNTYTLDGVESGIFPEFLVSFTTQDGILRLAGQVDLLIKDGNNISIIDFKTNKKLNFESFARWNPNKKRKEHDMMLTPLNKLMDCNMMHYTMQLSLYAYMIQRLNPDYNITQLRIVYFPHEGGCEEYELEYKKQDVINMLKHYKRSIQQEEYASIYKEENNSENNSESHIQSKDSKINEIKNRSTQKEIERQKYIESRKKLNE